ncbi:MAG: sulfatase [Planctomycetaceae bacterium]|nr:sulfatase [Planctomycetaceae bacterium]
MWSKFFSAIAAVTMLIGTPGVGVSQTRAASPNVIIFIADDMAWDDCGAYGHPHIHTPNIDRLAAEGLRFDRAYLTCSSCSPSRCSTLTGRYPHSTGAGELHLPLPESQTLFTTPLRKAGYYTASVGKWHLGKAAESQVDLVKQGGGPGGEEHWVSVLQDRPKDKPFFLWLAATDPHRGYQPGAVDPPHTNADVVVPPIFPDTPDVRGDLALYYDEIARFDEYIGLVREELEAQGVLDNTLIMVISDNGRPFPRCKTTVYEDGVKTPLVVRFPPLISDGGNVSNAIVSTVDIANTVLDVAGLSPLPSSQGRSFAAVLKDPRQGHRDGAYSEHNWHDYRAFERSVVTDRFRYVHNWTDALPRTPPADAVRSPTYDEMKRLYAAGELAKHQATIFLAYQPSEELYDVTVDPHCLHNLAENEAYAEVIQQHRTLLKDWQQETDDTFPGVDNLTPDGFDRDTGDRLPGVAAPHPSLGKKGN